VPNVLGLGLEVSGLDLGLGLMTCGLINITDVNLPQNNVS